MLFSIFSRIARLHLLVMAACLLILAPASGIAAEEVLVYTALEDDEIPRYLAVFKKQHPDITVKIVRDSTGIITAKLLAEKSNPQADVVWGTAATSLMLCKQAGMLEPYAPKGLEKKKSRPSCAIPPTRLPGWESKPGKPDSA